MQVGDVQIDKDGSEWVIISVSGRDRTSRVRRYSNAHHIHAIGSDILSKSLEKEEDESNTQS